MSQIVNASIWSRNIMYLQISYAASESRSCIVQCTHCRGGAESVLTLDPTVIGVGLHRLGANLTRKKGKYTSASPRCTFLPSRQICIGLALSDPPQTPLQC